MRQRIQEKWVKSVQYMSPYMKYLPLKASADHVNCSKVCLRGTDCKIYDWFGSSGTTMCKVCNTNFTKKIQTFFNVNLDL